MRIDYDVVRDRAQEIDDVIQCLNARKVKLKEISNNLHLSWQGDAASTFKRKLDELIQELDKAIKDMAAIKKDILTVARNIQNEDERLANEVANACNVGLSASIFNNGGGGR